MHDDSERARHQEELAAQARDEGYARGATTAILAGALTDPLGSPLQDIEVCRLRAQAEKHLPAAPNDDKRSYVDATIGNLVVSGRLDNEKMPQTIQQWNDELVAQAEAEERARIKRIMGW